ncbi:hypothetical protein R6Q59_009352 [Mikania micrantha]
MVTGGEEMPDVEDVGKEYGLVKAHGSSRPYGWAFCFTITNTTILYYWSASLCEIEPVDPTSETTDYAMHLDRPPAFLKHFLDIIDVLVLNTGHYWNRGKLNANRWVMCGQGNGCEAVGCNGTVSGERGRSYIKIFDSSISKDARLFALVLARFLAQGVQVHRVRLRKILGSLYANEFAGYRFATPKLRPGQTGLAMAV